MLAQHDKEGTKRKNIIEMALGFTAMTRVFCKRSAPRIKVKLEEFFLRLADVRTRDDYDARHRSFCKWFTSAIWTAEKKRKNGKVQPSQPSSYGHAAKVLDIAAKVYVYYCSQPNAQVAQRIMPFLKGAIDVPIMRHLRKLEHATSKIRATSIQDVDETTYEALQSVVSTKAAASAKLPVEFEDFLWRELNRKDCPVKTV